MKHFYSLLASSSLHFVNMMTFKNSEGNGSILHRDGNKLIAVGFLTTLIHILITGLDHTSSFESLIRCTLRRAVSAPLHHLVFRNNFLKKSHMLTFLHGNGRKLQERALCLKTMTSFTK